MWRFLARTIVQRLLLLVVISIVSHTVIHLAPGEPTEVDSMNPMMKAEDVARIRASFHLNDPLYLQYVHWMKDLCTGELKSFRDGLPVVPKIWQRFLNSLPLFLCTTLIVWTASFPIGIQAALKRGSRYDRGATFVAYTLISIPGFFLSYLLILWVVRTFHLPVIGLRTFGTESASAARAKGLDEDHVVYGHALRNALLPFVTMFGLLLPGLISGSVIFEQIFAWPGLGLLGYEAILARDFPMILTLNFMAAALTLLGILVSDILYALVDPRIRLE
jgi:peptide/nickel transport system permease protein